MKRAKHISTVIVDFFVYSNLLISIAAFLFTVQTALHFRYSGAASAFFAITNFVSTFTLYNLQRIYQSTQLVNDQRLQWYRNNRRLLFTCILVFMSLYYLVFKANYIVFWDGLLLYIPAAVLSLIYFLPPFTLRRLPFFKIFFIGFVWAASGIIIPLMYEEYRFSYEHLGKEELAYMAAQLLFIAAICIPFDIRDIESDRKHTIKTLAVTHGLSKTKTIGIILLLIYMSLAQNSIQLFIYVLTGVPGIILILYSATHRHRYYYSVLVDGLIICQFVFSLLLLKGY